jgi:hypothetical protein
MVDESRMDSETAQRVIEEMAYGGATWTVCSTP